MHLHSISDPSLTLMVLDPEIDVQEPDEGMNYTVTTCYQANVTQMRKREAVFVFTLLSSSTATDMVDFETDRDASYVIIPVGFYGIFRECANVTIIGDDIIEYDEVIEYELVPLSDRDSVEPPPPLRINILDNDGEHKKDTLTLGVHILCI